MTAVHPDWIVPDWSVFDRVDATRLSRLRSLVTTRNGGVSAAPYQSMNLGQGVGDDPEAVRRNRHRLASRLPASPYWLRQVHGTVVARPAQLPAPAGTAPQADAAFTGQPGQVLVVLTADCLPVLLAADDGSEVGVAHAGWRGLLAGVIENLVAVMATPAHRLLAWLGPAIGPGAFEVGPEVREPFADEGPAAALAFRPGRGDRWMADIYQLARWRLGRIGINRIGGGDFCTFSEPQRFYSYRRDGITGRMASLLWIAPD